MVGDDAVRSAGGPFGRNAGLLLDGADERLEEIDVVVVVLPLQDGGDPLQAHPRIDGGLRKVDPFLLRDLLVLHEDQVPDLDEAVAISVGRAWRPAGNALAMVEEDLGARPTRARVAHGPEIVRGRNPDDPVLGQAGDAAPEGEGLVIRREHGHGQFVGWQAELPGDEIPGKFDRDVLEVVSEREVAEHLEEGVMARGVADVVEVVVLAAGADAFLGRHGTAVGALLDTGKDILELHHAGIGEHQSRVVAGYEGARRHDLVTVLAEIFQKGRPDFVQARHVGDCFPVPCTDGGGGIIAVSALRTPASP